MVSECAKVELKRVILQPGFHTTARELQTCTFQAPGASKHHQNSARRHPRERQKERNGGGRGKKKRKFLGPPPFCAPPFLEGPTIRCPTLSLPHPSLPHPSLPHPSGPHPSGPQKVFVLLCFFFHLVFLFFLKKKGQKTETPILAKLVNTMKH